MAAKTGMKKKLQYWGTGRRKKAVARVRRRPEEKDRYIDMELQYKLRKEYVDICTSNRGILISTMKSEDECYDIVKNAVKEKLKNGNL